MASGMGRGNKTPRRAPGEPSLGADVKKTRLVVSEKRELC